MRTRSSGSCARAGAVFVLPPGHAQLSALSVVLGNRLLSRGGGRCASACGVNACGARATGALAESGSGSGSDGGRRIRAAAAQCGAWVREAEGSLRRAVASMLAESFAAFTLYPLDTVKLRCQLRLPTSLNSSRQMIPRITQLYSGVASAALVAAPVAAVFATVYHSTKRRLRELVPLEQFGFVTAIAAGAAGTAMSSLVDTPFRLCRELVQCGACSSAGAAWRQVFGSGSAGRRHLSSAYRADLMSSLPFDALEFATYEHLSRLLGKARGGRELTAGELLAVGALTGALVGAVTSPLSVLRARMASQPLRYTGIRQSLRLIFREEGPRGLFSGVSASVAREALNSGVFFFALEGFNSMLSVEGERKKNAESSSVVAF